MAMDVALSSMMAASSSLFPSGSLLESLILLSNEVAFEEKAPFIHAKTISTMRRRIKLLAFLFEEVQESNSPLPPSSILCLTEIFSVIRRVKILTQSCEEGSCLWSLLQTESISNQFYQFVKEIGRVLDILPLSLLKLTDDTREQVELLHSQAKRFEFSVNAREVQRRDELLQLMSNKERNYKNKGLGEVGKIKEIFSSVGLRNMMDCDEEISKLEAEALKQAGTGGIIVVSNINNLISLVKHAKTVIFSKKENENDGGKYNLKFQHSNKHLDHSSSSNSLVQIPDDFRCPISLDFMRDPVIISSGHTYDRYSIAQWIDSGHHVCPKSNQRLIHMALIPNYALKSLMQQWCQENNINMNEPTKPYSSFGLERSNSKKYLSEEPVDHISASKAASDAVKMTAEFLVGKLATGSPDIQRQAAYELRLLAKTGMDNRRMIAEAGAIPFLVTLLKSGDPRIEENAVTALFNLAIFNNNKILIVAAGAIDNITHILESGKTMEARENAAATIYSLTMVDEFKITIGASPKAIPALVRLLKEGNSAGKRDAATALCNLALYNANKACIVVAGAVPLLIELLTDDKAGITDDALQALSLVLGCSEGLQEIRKSRVLVSLLIDLLRFGSPKGKDSSLTLLLGLCKDGGEEVARRLLINPRSIPSLQSLAADGSLKARRKADALLRLLNRCCFQSQPC
ncbi:U-box domain-containing protein 13-like [Cucumis melo var. makuwa]|uniref:RING-type E3 ubiquitin transferase n=2 Tax=Cucumis melo TaxID=3656 RepID=A0A1S3B3K6_CUCME|nr:U-box domain-containing protein 1-like [Cucumis melo]KAA0055024.1 U-box domain-containing protein 13-like [Cucumis melo var. makuwa]